MDRLAELAIGWLCRKAGDWLAGSNENGKLHEFEPSVKYLDDDAGRHLIIRVPSGAGEGNHASIFLMSSPETYIKAVSDYADAAGDFVQGGEFIGDLCLLYVPFSALCYARAGEYTMSVVVLRPGSSERDPTPLARALFTFPLPTPMRWNKVAHLSPLIDLCMIVVRATGSAVPEKVREMKSLFAEQCGLTAGEVTELREAMKRAKAGDVSTVAKRAWFRFPDLKITGVLTLLAEIARSDGDLTAAELSIIRETAFSIGADETTWPVFAEQLQLTLDDPWETLGVRPGASLSDIKSAYRCKISEYHPDRHAQAPRELQELATKLTVDLQRAYERLKQRCCSAAPVASGAACG